MRLVTFNILHGKSSTDPEERAKEEVSVSTFASIIAELNPDVLALQEVDRDQHRSQHSDLTAVAAEAMNAVSHRFVAALSGTPGATWMAATGTEQPGEAAYGIALLSRYPARSWNVIRLPNVAAPFPMWLSEPRKWVLVHEEPRVCVSACLDSPDGPITVANTHLSFVPGWNRWQLRRLRKAFTGIAEPLVLLGDLNMETDKAVSATGYRPLATLATFPKHQPSRQLDHALARGTGFDSVTCSAPELAISDHRALVVDVVHRSV